MRSTALLASILLALGASTVAYAQAQPTAAPQTPPAQENPPAPAESATPAPEPPAAPAPAVSPEAAPAPAPAPPPPPPPAAKDRERPPPDKLPEPERVPGFTARLSLGIAASLWINGEEAVLHEPGTLTLDLGYSITPELVLGVRGTSWIQTSGFANEFLGLAATIYLDERNMYVTGALGVGITRANEISQWKHYVQGVALQADIGQVWSVTDWSEFSLGAQFQIGTPFGGTKPDAFTSLMAGVFVAYGIH